MRLNDFNAYIYHIKEEIDMWSRTSPIPSIASQIDLIEKTLDQIYQIFLKAFSEGKAELQDTEFHKVAVYNQLWRRLRKKVSSFSTIAELNLYYQQQSENLNVEINDYCTKHGNPKISTNKRELCRYLIKVYHLLIRQQYFLHQLNEMIKQINTFNKHCQREIEGLKDIDVAHIKDKVTQMDLVLFELVSCLDPNNEVKSKYKFYSGKSSDENKLLAPVATQIKRLPAIKSLATIAKSAREAASKGDEAALSQFQRQAKAIALVTQSIYNNIQQLFSTYLNENTVMIAKWKRNDEFVSAFMDSEQLINSTCDLLANLVRDMQHVVSTSALGIAKNAYDEIKIAGLNLVELCKSQSAAAKMPQMIWDNGWKEAMTKTAKLLTELAENLDGFVKHYNNPPDMAGLRANIKSLLQRQHESEECRKLLVDESDKIEKVWTSCSSHLLEAEELDTRLNKLKANPVKHFMRQHWWKMLVGGVIVGAAVITTVTLLLFPPLIIAIAAVCSIVGGALLGAAAGILTDIFCKPHTQRLTLTEAENMLHTPGRRTSKQALVTDSPSLTRIDDKEIAMTVFKDYSSESTSTVSQRLFKPLKQDQKNSEEVSLKQLPQLL